MVVFRGRAHMPHTKATVSNSFSPHLCPGARLCCTVTLRGRVARPDRNWGLLGRWCEPDFLHMSLGQGHQSTQVYLIPGCPCWPSRLTKIPGDWASSGKSSCGRNNLGLILPFSEPPLLLSALAHLLPDPPLGTHLLLPSTHTQSHTAHPVGSSLHPVCLPGKPPSSHPDQAPASACQHSP